jgi:hypothetical protein
MPPALAADVPPAADEPAFVAAETGSWPQYGCDAGCRFATTGSFALPLAMAWEYRKASPVANVASFVVTDDRVVLSCIGDKNRGGHNGGDANNPYLIGLDSMTGAKSWEWSHKHDWALGCQLAICGDKVFFNDDGFNGIEWKTGNIGSWKGGRVNKANEADSWGVTSVDEKAGVIVQSCTMKVDNPGTLVQAWDLDYHRTWKALHDDGKKLDDRWTATALSQGGGMVFAVIALSGSSPKKHVDGLYGLKQSDGAEVWSLPGKWGGVSFDGEHAFAVGMQGKDTGPKLYCLDPVDGKSAWSVAVGEPARHPPAHGRGTCIVITDRGSILAFPTRGAKAGKALAWRSGGSPVPNDDPAVPVAAIAIAEGAGKNGLVVIANGGNSIRFMDLKTGAAAGELPWDSKLGKPRNPAIANGRIYVNGSEGVACYATPEKKKR